MSAASSVDTVATVRAWQRSFDTFLPDWNTAAAVTLPGEWLDHFNESVGRQNQLACQGSWLAGPRSLFGVLGIRHLEKTHSAVLAWLLDPSGWHGLGDALLKQLLRRVGLVEHPSYERVRVISEEVCEHPDLEQYGYCDIVVRGVDWTVVIENKVWAGQSGHQLDLYFDVHSLSAAHFVYLTPDGTPARSLRPEVAGAYQSLSWRSAIMPDIAVAIDVRRQEGYDVTAATEYLHALEEEFP